MTLESIDLERLKYCLVIDKTTRKQKIQVKMLTKRFASAKVPHAVAIILHAFSQWQFEASIIEFADLVQKNPRPRFLVQAGRLTDRKLVAAYTSGPLWSVDVDDANMKHKVPDTRTYLRR